MASLRPVLRPDPEQGMVMSVELTRNKTGVQLLDEAISGFSKLNSSRINCNIAMDEFQEITELKESFKIEGILRSYTMPAERILFFYRQQAQDLIRYFQ